MSAKLKKSVAVIVAHPDDETLWAGGTILGWPDWEWYIISLCRKSDQERADKFYKVLKILNAQGAMGDLDDGPEQTPLSDEVVRRAILDLTPQKHFDLIITHHPKGEYTRHRRHEETGKAVIELWYAGKIVTDELWTFAYEDGEKQYYPRAVKEASIYHPIPEAIWLRKYSLITNIYGFGENGFEAQTTPKAEAFWRFTNAVEALHWLKSGSENL